MTTGRRSKTTDATILSAEGEGEEDALKPRAQRSRRRWRLAGDRGSMVWVEGGAAREEAKGVGEEAESEGEERTLF
jgi:hypothetical protein